MHRSAIVRLVAGSLALLAAGVWLGGIVVLGAIVAPTVFGIVPAPTSADAMTVVFVSFDKIAMTAAAIVAVAEVVRSRAAPAHRGEAADQATVTRVDVARWGHAMARPSPGFVFGGARAAAARPYRGVHFAHIELSGVALFEEAFFHGVRAADEALAAVHPA